MAIRLTNYRNNLTTENVMVNVAIKASRHIGEYKGQPIYFRDIVKNKAGHFPLASKIGKVSFQMKDNWLVESNYIMEERLAIPFAAERIELAIYDEILGRIHGLNSSERSTFALDHDILAEWCPLLHTVKLTEVEVLKWNPNFNVVPQIPK